VRDPITAMEAVAAGIVVGLYRFVVRKPLEVVGDDALQLRARGTIFNRDDGVEDRVVRNDVLRDGTCLRSRLYGQVARLPLSVSALAIMRQSRFVTRFTSADK
jgi:hypothetical protein